MKIALIASEVVPFAKTGGLADVAGALPVALEDNGCEVIIIMPGYKCVADAGLKITRVSKDISSSVLGKGVKVYFVENGPYFEREGLYMDKRGDYKDNLERFAFFCRRGLELLKEINFSADILHLHDWQSSLAGVYLKNIYARDPFYSRMKSVLTIHNIGYQGIFPGEDFAKLGLDKGLFNISGLEFYGKVNLLKSGIIFSELINTVSPTYALEIQDSKFGFGLEGLLKQRAKDLTGILNGLDYSIWDPGTDKFIARKFSQKNMEGKAYDKEDLQRACSLPVDKEIPVMGIVSRLAEQKGFDILTESLDEICKTGAQLVILGTGNLKYHQILKKAAKKYPKALSLNLRFDDPLAHKIYAGSDIFLMPSHYEPCGLGQMIALRYGSIPLVFKTGGLADTVNEDNGFLFSKYAKADLLKTIKRCLAAFRDRKKWGLLMEKALRSDFSWEVSAKKYIRMYEKAKEG